MKMKFNSSGDFAWAKLKDYQRHRGLYSSPKRTRVIEVFLRDDRHVTVEELYAAVHRSNPTIGRSTVYRTLRLLADAGLAASNRFAEGTVRYEPVHRVSPHDHFICERCGRIIEFNEPAIARLRRRFARDRGLRVTSHRLQFFGLCDRCCHKEPKQ